MSNPWIGVALVAASPVLISASITVIALRALKDTKPAERVAIIRALALLFRRQIK